MSIELIINLALVAIMVATYFVNDRVNRLIKEKVNRLENQRDLATMVALQIIQNRLVEQEDYKGAQRIKDLIGKFETGDYDITITSEVLKSKK